MYFLIKYLIQVKEYIFILMNSPTLVLLYSINSPKCDQLRSLLKDEYLGFFKAINISDNLNVYFD